MKSFTYEEVRAATNDFDLDLLVGKGSHGCVYKALLKGGVAVAVKQPKPTSAEPSKLDNEINILSSCRSQHIVNLVGFARSPSGDKMLIMDYMPNGSLEELLHSSPDPPDWRRRAAVAIGVGRALLGLHRASPPVVHRDVKPANVLFDARWRARLADFSLAARSDGSCVPAAGTFGYIDPGYVRPGQLWPGVDVFSFGVMLLELLTGGRAIEVGREPAWVVEWAVPRIDEGGEAALEVTDGRVGVGEGMEVVVEKMMEVAARCVSKEWLRRPGMEEVVGELERAVEMVWRPVCGVGEVGRAVERWMRGWRRRRKKRVTSTATTKLIYEIDGGD